MVSDAVFAPPQGPLLHGSIKPGARPKIRLFCHMSAESTPAPVKPKKINLRTPDVMAKVQEQVESHYRSVVVERIRANGGILTVRDTTVRLAKQFGFCYGVERAIDLAYAARKSFRRKPRLYLGRDHSQPLGQRADRRHGDQESARQRTRSRNRRTYRRRCRDRSRLSEPI